VSETSFLSATETLDFEHPKVAEFTDRHVAGATSDVERAVRLFAAVRDGVLYDPYTCVMTPERFRASSTLARGRAWCVPKAVLLAAALRGDPGAARVHGRAEPPLDRAAA
jgi:transglutaminase-like putative cysteine protease